LNFIRAESGDSAVVIRFVVEDGVFGIQDEPGDAVLK
jgi:hypothetical protein